MMCLSTLPRHSRWLIFLPLIPHLRSYLFTTYIIRAPCVGLLLCRPNECLFSPINQATRSIERTRELSYRFSFAALDFNYPTSHKTAARMVRGMIRRQTVARWGCTLHVRYRIHGHVRGYPYVHAATGMVPGHEHCVLHAHVLVLLLLPLHRSRASDLLLLSLELARGALLLLLLLHLLLQQSTLSRENHGYKAQSVILLAENE